MILERPYRFRLGIYRCLELSLLLVLFMQVMNGQSISYAGFRASRILNSYPNRQFPSPQYWSNTAGTIASKFPGSSPAGIWIVSLYISNGTTQFNFPSNGASLPYVNFISTDQNESYLKHFDTTGVRVWLQVEPGEANIDTLISLVLNRYKHHPCVLGFGVDVEWYKNNSKITDALAQQWEEKVKSIDTSYTLFLKHYGRSWMPQVYRGNILFVDDSQDFSSSSTPLNYMVNEFKAWGALFAPNKVAFQYGYAADSVWWRSYADPLKTIGDALRSAIPTTEALFWVDFTIAKLFPITDVHQQNTLPTLFSLKQNFPNPFNPATTIKFQIPTRAFVSLIVYNLLGKQVETLLTEDLPPGEYSKQWNASGLPSGVYFYRLQAGVFVETKKLVAVR
ncbi:MAG: T9SS type A sorting domain-containing protein [bacterium]